MVPAGTMVLSKDAQALQLEQGILGPASPIPSPCLLLKNMFNPSECASPPPLAWLGYIGCNMYLPRYSGLYSVAAVYASWRLPARSLDAARVEDLVFAGRQNQLGMRTLQGT